MTRPSRFVIDASAGIKLMVPEEHSEDIRSMVGVCLGKEEECLFVPDLFFIECANILWKKVQREAYDLEMARDNLIDLRELELSVTPTSELAYRALGIACAHHISAYDACYLALSELTGATLLTADERLRNAIGAAFDVTLLAG